MGPRVSRFIYWVVVAGLALIAAGAQEAANLHNNTPPAPAVTTPAGHR